MGGSKGKQAKEARRWRIRVRGWLNRPRNLFAAILGFDWLRHLRNFMGAIGYIATALFALAMFVLFGGGVYACYVLAQKTFSPSWDQIADIEAAKVFFPVLVALIGGPLLVWRIIAAHWTAQAARKQADTDREGFYTGLFTKAVEQLGATREVKKISGSVETEPNLEVRLGAIYALDRIAQDSERDHWPIMQVLCSYIRNPQNTHAPMPPPKDSQRGFKREYEWKKSIHATRVDVQAAITVIGSRSLKRIELEKERNQYLNFTGANLQRAIFNGGHFERSIFNEVRLEFASFMRAQLESANFDLTRLDHADFTDANLSGSSFSSSEINEVNFRKARLDHVYFDWSSINASYFEGASIIGTSFDFTDIENVEFFDTDLSLTNNLDSTMLASNFGDTTTKLPIGIDPPDDWPKQKLDYFARLDWMQESRNKRNKEKKADS